MTKKKKKISNEENVIEKLLEKDTVLARRDIECKLFKIRWKKHQRNKVFQYQELAESNEQFKHWWKPDLPNVYFAMSSRHRTCYRKGD